MDGSNTRGSGQPIRVAVVDDHELVRSGICGALSTSPEISVVGQAGDGLAALDLLERQPVDVLLLDLHMPRMDGFACLDAVKIKWPELPVIVLTVEDDERVAVDVIRRGAAAYVPKFVRPSDLASLVRQVATGSVLMGGPKLAGALAGGVERPSGVSESPYGLTPRELEVLELVARGHSNADIASRLFVTTKTVKYHLSGIFAKLGVHNRTEAAALALGQGVVAAQRSISNRPRL